MKVIFVGMHNKPGMKPLDSKTKTGKIVDEIIPFIKCSCIKSNLCDVDYMPTSNEDIHMFNMDWYLRVDPDVNDIIVLLGRCVQENFIRHSTNIVELSHPASFIATNNRGAYINRAISAINEKINKTNPFKNIKNT